MPSKHLYDGLLKNASLDTVQVLRQLNLTKEFCSGESRATVANCPSNLEEKKLGPSSPENIGHWAGNFP